MSKSNPIKLACNFTGCQSTHHAKGFCQSHLRQIVKGYPLTVLRKQRASGSVPVIEYREVVCRVAGLIGPCHEWIHGKSNYGYGIVSHKRKMVGVHRYIWEKTKGKIKDGLVVDHQCRNRACCNVDHLRLVTRVKNVMENSEGICARNAAKTHCKHGHPFDEKNTSIKKSGKRDCKECNRIRMSLQR